jgi:hypothetical protein
MRVDANQTTCKLVLPNRGGGGFGFWRKSLNFEQNSLFHLMAASLNGKFDQSLFTLFCSQIIPNSIMPGGNRRTPFSGKKKKVQLQEKRQRKAQTTGMLFEGYKSHFF